MSVVYIPITKELFGIATRLTQIRMFPHLGELLESGNIVAAEHAANGGAEGFRQYLGFIEVYTEHLDNFQTEGLDLTQYEYEWHPVNFSTRELLEYPSLIRGPVVHVVDSNTLMIPSYGVKAEVKHMCLNEIVELFNTGFCVGSLTQTLPEEIPAELEAERALTIRERFIDALRVKTRNKPSNMPDLKLNKHGSFANAKTQAMFDGYRLFDDERFVMHKKRGDKVYPMGQFIIGTLDSIGAPHFSRAPYRHNTYYGAKAEAERLIKHLPKRFAIFRCCDVIDHTKGTE